MIIYILDNLSEKLRQAEQIDATFNELRKTYHLQQITLEGVTAEKNNLQTATIELEKENSDLAAQIKILEENKIQLTEQLNTFAIMGISITSLQIIATIYLTTMLL